MSSRSPLALALLVALALSAFAANSILCRLALRPRSIDPATFTLVRLASGALALRLLVGFRRGQRAGRGGGFVGALALCAYALAFSLAYLGLTAGVGALLLFGAVQITMIGRALLAGARPSPAEALGLVLALAGLAGLAAPGATAVDPLSALSMLAAGVAWGVYSLRGRGSADPLGDTAHNFALALLVAAPLIAYPLLSSAARWTAAGLVLASISGALASGVGYALWYAALRDLSATRAALLQLLVPVLAALLGVALLGESVTPRLLLCGSAILAGVALALVRRR